MKTLIDENEQLKKSVKQHAEKMDVRTIKETGKIIEIRAAPRKYGISTPALQEIRWQGKSEIKTKKFATIYSGEEKGGQKGVAFIVFGTMTERIIKTRLINGRMVYINTEMDPYNLSLLNVYAPSKNAKEEEKEKFYEEAEKEYTTIPKEDAIIILGDLNAQIEKRWKEKWNQELNGSEQRTRT
ncbi:hypothetical protein ILUMI_11124 [Ignelater luminosus]|uniref:Craniofacial development protein 2-like n=1 Tax=Ignelater luminosus TaxID=2038154 RepID=A0A8K0GDI6_IGNLU|nr:hypothetical protein ILUMI_11124 [Ignelater luminosus]